MAREQVTSSNIKAVGYDKNSKLLEVEFHNGTVYQYEGVDEAAYKDLKEASSVGRHFTAFIRNNYPFKKIA